MQTILFPLFVGLGMSLAALSYLVLGPGLLMQGFFFISAVLVAALLLQTGDAD